VATVTPSIHAITTSLPLRKGTFEAINLRHSASALLWSYASAKKKYVECSCNDAQRALIFCILYRPRNAIGGELIGESARSLGRNYFSNTLLTKLLD
jgi:hypothetical protein